ncbi:hypothetical protein ACOSP7_006893 [Xanthoceras sorbifolium]
MFAYFIHKEKYKVKRQKAPVIVVFLLWWKFCFVEIEITVLSGYVEGNAVWFETFHLQVKFQFHGIFLNDLGPGFIPLNSTTLHGRSKKDMLELDNLSCSIEPKNTLVSARKF